MFPGFGPASLRKLLSLPHCKVLWLPWDPFPRTRGSEGPLTGWASSFTETQTPALRLHQRGLQPGFAAASPRARPGSGARAPAPGAAPAERDGAAGGAETPPSPAQPHSPLPKTPALPAGAPPPGTSRGERGGLRAPGGPVSPPGPPPLTRGRSCSWGSAAARCSRGNGAACARRCGR